MPDQDTKRIRLLASIDGVVKAGTGSVLDLPVALAEGLTGAGRAEDAAGAELVLVVDVTQGQALAAAQAVAAAEEQAALAVMQQAAVAPVQEAPAPDAEPSAEPDMAPPLAPAEPPPADAG